MLRAHLAAQTVMAPLNKTHSDQASAVAVGLYAANGFLSHGKSAISANLDYYPLKLAIWCTCLHKF